MIDAILVIAGIVAVIFGIVTFLGYLWDAVTDKDNYDDYKYHCKNDGALPISFEQFKSLYNVAPEKWGWNQDFNGEVHYFYEEDSQRIFSTRKTQAFYFKTSKDWKNYKKWFANIEKRKAEEANIIKMEEMLEYWKEDVKEWKEQGSAMVSTAAKNLKKYT